MNGPTGTSSPTPPQQLAARIEHLTGRRIVRVRPATGGYTPAQRWILALEDGSTLFAKSGRAVESSAVASWLRLEHRAYSEIAAPFMPRLLGWDDDGDEPVLLLEDLSRAFWPPPWSAGRIGQLWDTLGAVRAVEPPSWAPDLEDAQRGRLSGWERVRHEPAPFLRLELATPAWLQQSLPVLVDAAARAPLSGDSLVHFDIRSDNLCFVGDDMKIIDWNYAARGHPDVDRFCVLPSLHREGGPAPWEVVQESGGFSALLSGYLAAQSGLPLIPSAPDVRRQLLSALPWAVIELGLPPLDGPGASAE